jgi:hypothetical protein
LPRALGIRSYANPRSSPIKGACVGDAAMPDAARLSGCFDRLGVSSTFSPTTVPLADRQRVGDEVRR